MTSSRLLCQVDWKIVVDVLREYWGPQKKIKYGELKLIKN